jgi:uncharacterized protein involved in propanediol utilization
LRKAEHDTEDWQAAMEALSLVAGHDGSQRPRHRNDRASMSEMGPAGKNSVRANVLRFALELGHCSTQSACLKRADTAKLFLHRPRQIFRAVRAAIE